MVELLKILRSVELNSSTCMASFSNVSLIIPMPLLNNLKSIQIKGFVRV